MVWVSDSRRRFKGLGSRTGGAVFCVRFLVAIVGSASLVGLVIGFVYDSALAYTRLPNCNDVKSQ
jgi:hypothetical protein